MLSFIKNLFKSSTTPYVSPVSTTNVLFTPYHDFFSAELQSQYVAGLIYTVRPGNAKLALQVGTWVLEKKVKIVDSNAKIAGKGKVS